MITQTETQSNRIIDEAKQRIIARHPHLANMANMSAEYAARENGVVCLSPTLAHVRNVEGTTYRLTYTQDDGWHCTCPSFLYRPTIINDRRYCKHIIALSIHNKLINGGI